jgi:hypothetical protein
MSGKFSEAQIEEENAVSSENELIDAIFVSLKIATGFVDIFAIRIKQNSWSAENKAGASTKESC